MARRKRGRDIDGVILLDKPRGLSSNHALQRVRRAYDARKGGHTGSLDPLASGLLPVCLGEATKLASYLLSADKAYRVTAHVGCETTTGDAEGDMSARSDRPMPPADALQALLARFVGDQTQVPPMYSALKVNGRPLYEYARSGRTVERAPRPVTVHGIDIVDAEADRLTLDVSVSGGTYVRTLIEDIARAWGGCAHVVALRRTRVGALGQRHAMTPLAALEEETRGVAARAAALRPLSALIADWPAARLDAGQAEAIRHGRAVSGDWPATDALCRIESPAGALLGLGVVDGARLRPRRMFARPQF